MLEKPDLPDEQIITCLQNNYGLAVAGISFLPLGADLGTSVYRAKDRDGQTYFVKLRRVPFDEIAVTLPKFLSTLGIMQIIVPLASKTGQLWADMDPFKLILYPYIRGLNGYETSLSDSQWIAFGAVLQQIHTAPIPASLTGSIRRETNAPRWRQTVRSFLERIDDAVYDDPVALDVTAFLQSKRAAIHDLVDRAERLALLLEHRSPDFIVCHSDLHAGNIHITDDGAFYIVDWDAPILAPKERDLMTIGGGLMARWRPPSEEEALFYQGYGQVEIDPAAMAYYRYERIIEDIGIYCEQLLLTDEGGEDREQSLRYLKSNFLPNHTIETAYKSDRTMQAG